MKLLGNIELLKLPKTGFLCSRNIKPADVLKCYDWGTEQRKSDNCVMSGFHSKIEKDVLHFLLKGKQPLILVLGRSLYKKIPEEFIKPLEENSLLIVSVVYQTPNRQSVESAMIRNKYIIENADEVVFGSLDPNGMLNQLFTETKDLYKYIIL